MKVQVEDRLAGIVARVAGEAVAGRLRAHLAGDPSGDRDQPTEGGLVPRVGLSCGRQMRLRTTKKWTGAIRTGWSFGMSNATARSSS